MTKTTYINVNTNKVVSKWAVLKQLQRKGGLANTYENIVKLGYVENKPKLEEHPRSSQILYSRESDKLFNPLTNKYIKNTRANIVKIEKQVPEWLKGLNDYANDYKAYKQARLQPNQFDITKTGFLNKLARYFKSKGIKGGFKMNIKSLKTSTGGRIREIMMNDYSQLDKFWRDYMSEPSNYTRVAKSTQTKEMSSGYYSQFELSDVETLTGGCNKHTEDQYAIRDITVSPTLSVKLHNLKGSRRNQCGYKCLIFILQKYFEPIEFMSYSMVCKRLKYTPNECMNTEQIREVYHLLLNDLRDRNAPLKVDAIKDLDIYTDMCEQSFIDGINKDSDKLILLDNHFYVFISATVVEQKKERMGDLRTGTYDFEARSEDEYTHMVGSTQASKLKDTILYYGIQKYGQHKSIKFETKLLITNKDKTSGRQFLDFLNSSKHCYRFWAHNGSNFDVLILMDYMTDEEYAKCSIFRKGLSFTKITYTVSSTVQHVFVDSRDHLLGSLDSICDNFQIKNAKLKYVNIAGNKISSTQLCFYKPDLKFWDFMDLQNTDKEFWNLYTHYCRMDVESLYEIMMKYKECDSIRLDLAEIPKELKHKYSKEKSLPFVLKDGVESTYTSNDICKRGNISDKLTISSGAMNLLKLTINEINKYDYKRMKTFFEYKQGDLEVQDPLRKENTSRLCNVGGMSHVKTSGIFGQIEDADEVSQYAAAQMHCIIPVGKSKYYTGEELKSLEDYSLFKFYGCYSLINVKFKDSCNSLKPVPYRQEGKSYQWDSPSLHETMNVDSQMLVYMVMKGWIDSYEIESALLSKECIKGSDLSAHYINTVFAKKAEQDKYKKTKDPRYNPSIREVHKSCLTSPYGKMNEDRTRYSTIIQKHEYDKLEEEKKLDYSIVVMNGVNMYNKKTSAKVNEFIMYSVSILSYSKIMLFEYMECLENGLDDVLAIETDGFMYQYTPEKSRAFKERVNNWKFLETGRVDLELINKPEVQASPYLRAFQDYPLGFGSGMGQLAIKSVSHPEFSSYVVMKKTYRYVEESGRDFDSDELQEFQATGKIPLAYEMGKDKKLYKIVSKMKGICEFDIKDDGTKYRVVQEDHYQRLLTGDTIGYKFKALKKLYTKELGIVAYEMTRNIRKT